MHVCHVRKRAPAPRSNAEHYTVADRFAPRMARALIDGLDAWREAWSMDRLQDILHRGTTSELLAAQPFNDALRFPVGEALAELFGMVARAELKRLWAQNGW